MKESIVIRWTVIACEQGVSGGTAGWRLDVMSFEYTAFGGKTINVWGLNVIDTIAAQLGAQIVHADE
jgi:hypothetical protein